MSSNRRTNPIAGKYAPSEEYRRKLRQKHVLEGICLVLSVLMILLCAAYMLELYRGMLVPKAIVIMGAILNFVLSIRVFLERHWLAAAGLLVASAACVGGYAYLVLT